MTDRFDLLRTKVEVYLPSRAIKRIEKAYEFAKRAHDQQFRKSGEAYILHPVEVAIILADLEQDTMTICAALLHDTVEDSDVQLSEIDAQFGHGVRHLVAGVTKLGKIYFGTELDHQAENLRKMLLAMAEDLRVVIIKLADRLHNMRTLKHLNREKQVKIAKETRDIFAPLSHRLGMGSLKWELEDLAFYYLDPEAFQNVKSIVASKRDERQSNIDLFVDRLRGEVKNAEIDAKIDGRAKNFSSIYKKLQRNDNSSAELYDLLGIRILVPSIKDCYEVLGMVHSIYKPIAGRIKDYIAMPKSNMYQSLHTTVIGEQGQPFEIQIRTFEMHQVAEYGIAAHWKYKEGEVHTRFDGDFSWLRQIIETQKEQSGSGFIESLKLDLFTDEVFVFTPRGDVQVLPKGATPLDFAYKVHTEIGNTCTGAKVNGVIKPLEYRLDNGDQVEILTSKRQSPKSDWLNFVRTTHAKSKIKYWLRRQSAIFNIQKGKDILEKHATLAGYMPKKVLSEDLLEGYYSKKGFKKSEEYFIAVAQGDLSPRSYINYLNQKFGMDTAETTLIADEKLMRPAEKNAAAKATAKAAGAKGDADGITVLGEKNITVNIGRCCHPVPGDDIIGFVTKGYGVTVHRTDCSNVVKLQGDEKQRLISVEWTALGNKSYPLTLYIKAFDRIGLLKDITNRISEADIDIRDIRLHGGKDNAVTLSVVVLIRDLDQLQKLKASLSGVPDIYSIRRSIA